MNFFIKMFSHLDNKFNIKYFVSIVLTYFLLRDPPIGALEGRLESNKEKSPAGE